MQKWEYTVIKTSNADAIRINGYGDNGWELVAVTFDANAGTFSYFLKRPKS